MAFASSSGRSTLKAIATQTVRPGSPFRGLLPRLARPAVVPPVLRGSLWLGLLATTTVVIGGVLAGAAAPSDGGRLWSVPTIPVRPSADLLLALVVFYGGLILLVRAWLKLRRDARDGGASVAAVAVVVVVWSLPLLAGPPIGSRDVYAYAAQGRLAEEGYDVYQEGPAALGDDPVLDAMDPLYLDAPVVYGPVFVAMSSLVTSQTGGELVTTVLAFRALAVLGLIAAAVGVWDLARGLGRDPVDALVLSIANPLVLLHLVSGAHNEALMLAFLIGGVAIGRRNWGRFPGIALCAFAASIKMPAILGVAFLAWPWAMEASGWPRRMLRVAASGLEAFIVIALAGRLTGWGWGWVDAITGAKPVDAYLSITRVLGGAVQLATGLDAVAVLTVARMAGLLLAGAVTAWLLFRGRESAVTALALSLLLFAILHPTTQPWYLTWGLMLWAAASAGNPNRMFLAVTGAAAFVVLPVGPQLGLVLLENNGVLSLLLAAAGLALLTYSPGGVLDDDDGRPRRRQLLESGLVSVVVPTRNEAGNIEPLVDRVLAAADGPVEILFVDDSDDDTPVVVEALAVRHPNVRLLHRAGEQRWGGLSGAVVDGMEVVNGQVAVVIDGDLQHPPEEIPALAAAAIRSGGLAIASRRVPGGTDADGLSPARRWLSLAATRLVRLAFPRRVGRTTDPLSGFFAVRLDLIDQSRLHPDGFKILLELLATHPELASADVPYRFSGREHGASKASVAQASRFLGHFIDLRLRTSRPWAGAVSSHRVYRSA